MEAHGCPLPLAEWRINGTQEMDDSIGTHSPDEWGKVDELVVSISLSHVVPEVGEGDESVADLKAELDLSVVLTYKLIRLRSEGKHDLLLGEGEERQCSC